MMFMEICAGGRSTKVAAGIMSLTAGILRIFCRFLDEGGPDSGESGSCIPAAKIYPDKEAKDARQ